MTLFVLIFLGLMGVSALIAFALSIIVTILYSTSRIGAFTFTNLALHQPYVNRVIDVVSILTTLSVTLILYFVFDIDHVTAFGIGFLSSLPMIIYWYFWRPSFLNKTVNFL